MAKPPLFAWLQEKPDSPTSNCSNGSFTFPALPQKTNSLPELEPDSHLFTTPPDLLCPITHEIFQDPVITLGAGQVYERSAISQHLSAPGPAIDPATRTVLPGRELTPVFCLRSRAAEFRETTSRACVERACSSSCPNPVKYLRRAVELAGDIPIPGLSAECTAYISTHPSNAYDTLALHVFACGLFAAGYSDNAAAVYYALLQAGADRAQQAELLRACLRCWTGGACAEPDANTVEKLAQFVEGQATFSWGQIIDIVQDANVGDQFALRLCERLLFHGEASTGSKLRSATPEHADWLRQKEVLLKYMQLVCSSLSVQQEELRAEVASRKRPSSPASSAGPGGGQVQAEGVCWHRPWAAWRGRWFCKLNIAKVVLAAATLAPGGTVLVRAARIMPLLYLLHHSADQAQC